jgi:malate dehydrogenase
VGGVPVTQLLSETEVDAILSKTISAGTEIVRLLKTTGSSYTAGQIMGRIAKSVVNEIPDIFSVDVMLDGQMGFSDVALSLPCIVGKNGVERVISIPESSACFQKLKDLARQFKQTCLAHGKGGQGSPA